jgi:hypothetical protein
MAIVVKKGLIGKEDIRWYSAASPYFNREISSGGTTTVRSLSATCIPITNATSIARSTWTANNVERALTEGITRYFGIDHTSASPKRGTHKNVFGFRPVSSGTSLQAVASNMYLEKGYARVVMDYAGATTAATSILLPRKCVLYGQGPYSKIRQNATTKTSALLRIHGTMGATSSILTCHATWKTNTVSVLDGTKFSKDQWVQIRSSAAGTAELHQIAGITGNTLTMRDQFLFHHHPVAGSAASLVYPAELILDDMRLEMNDAALGVGVSATYLTNSFFGKELTIADIPRSGIKMQYSQNNDIFSTFEYPRTANSYGVHCATWTHKTCIVGGYRRGALLDTSNAHATQNLAFGVQGAYGYNASHMNGYWFAGGTARQVGRISSSGTWSLAGTLNITGGLTTTAKTTLGGAGASVILMGATPVLMPLMPYIYRKNKPQVKFGYYNSSAGTACILCPGSTTAPTDVYIGGKIFRNKGTVICDPTREISPANATVGGRAKAGETALATYPLYVYAVPTTGAHLSATREWDLICSYRGPATGPWGAGATYPNWSFLQAIPKSSTSILPFVQRDDEIVFTFKEIYQKLWTTAGTIFQMATGWVTIPGRYAPFYTKSVTVGGLLTVADDEGSHTAQSILVNRGSIPRVSPTDCGGVYFGSFTKGGAAASLTLGQRFKVIVPSNATGQIAWSSTSHTARPYLVYFYIYGFSFPREEYR